MSNELKMKNIILFIAILLVRSSVAQVTKANQLVEDLVHKYNMVGAAAAYSKDGIAIWKCSVGFADRSAKQPFEISTETRLASIAKPMTAIAIMQLWEQGLIDLDAPIQTYIPDYPKHSKTHITTRHLLSHTSGIGGYKNGREAETTTEYATLYDALSIFKDRDLLFEPGTKWSYTTYGYTVLGVIIEKISGMSFEAYLQKNIWDVADMNHTGVVEFGVKKPNQSSIYRRNNKGKVKEGKENNLSNRIPGGGVYSTVEDMLKFGHGVINNLFVKESTIDLMREHHSLEKEANGYGFGWFLYNPKPNEGAIIGHSGAQSGSSTQLLIIPELKVVTVVLTNTSRGFQFVTPAAFNVFKAFQEE